MLLAVCALSSYGALGKFGEHSMQEASFVLSVCILHLAHSLHPAVYILRSAFYPCCAVFILPLVCILHLAHSLHFTLNKLKNNGDLPFTTTNEHQLWWSCLPLQHHTNKWMMAIKTVILLKQFSFDVIWCLSLLFYLLFVSTPCLFFFRLANVVYDAVI